MSKHSDPAHSSPAQLTLVNSARLARLRQQASQTVTPLMASAKSQPSAEEDKEIRRLRMLVESKLRDIVHHLPAGKQNSLFKIRYGITLDELHQLPVQKAAAILKINQRQR